MSKLASEQRFPKDLWLVVWHSDYSGRLVFDNQVDAIKHARRVCIEEQAQVFLCECSAFAKLTPVEPKMEPVT